ncbi:MAG: pantoate--beta-alanine ligase [Alphaproteobacteria bacterium]|nr:pantoate--beta-alanine ligase [Alphaproteobacteria bacterium]
MESARTIADLRRHIGIWRGGGDRIGLVPTMGALHQGHMALVRAARAECGRVVTSIFVNPKQFAPGEDLASYPRREAADLALLASAEVDLAFAPATADIYPAGFATVVRVTGLTDVLCGAHRAGHFDGVATVVTKLLLQSSPDAAYFGEKDYQQLIVVRRLVADLDIPVRIVGVPTVREPDGLALSSRNAYLTPEQRRIAPAIARVLRSIAEAVARRPNSVACELASGREELRKAGFSLEYLEIRDAETLTPVTDQLTAPSRVFVAARLGRTRLIDNMPLTPPA